MIVHAATTAMHCENSEVLPKASVAVAVMTFWPAGPEPVVKLKLALQPAAGVVTVVEPRKV